MTHLRMLGRKWWLFVPLLMALLIVAVACGEDATSTPAPTNTPRPTPTTAPTTAPTATTAADADATATPAPTATPRPTNTPVPQVAAATSTPRPTIAVEESRFVDHLKFAADHGETPRVGGIFKTGLLENFPHHDYHQGFSSNFYTEAPLYNGLMMTSPYDWTEAVVPDLAYKWEVSSDGLKYTFNLHEDVRWHDGRPFSSEDVKYSFERILFKGAVAGNTDTAGANFWVSVAWGPVVESFEAPDANTFVINAKGPSPVIQIFSNGYTRVIPKHQSAPDPVNALKDTLFPIGTGPQKMAKDASTTLWEMERNDDYFKPGLPYLDGYEAHLILDIQTRATAVLTQKIHINNPGTLPFLGFDLAKSIASQDDGIIHEGVPGLFALMMFINSTRVPLDDVRVRQALSEAINRQELVTEDPVTGKTGLGAQRGVIGTSVFPYGAWAMDQELQEQQIGFGPDMEVRRANARRLLAEYEAEKGPIDWGNIRMQDCMAQHVSCEIAELLPGMMKKVGIDPFVVQPGEIIAVFQKSVDGDYWTEQYFSGREGDDPNLLFGVSHITGGPRAFAGPTTEGMDELYQSQIYETDFEKRRQVAIQMDILALTDAKYVPHYWAVSEIIRWDFIKGWSTRPAYWDAMGAQEFLWLDLPENPLAQ
jgi:peptide/nickel transport system substrate-binding protein